MVQESLIEESLVEVFDKRAGCGGNFDRSLIEPVVKGFDGRVFT